MAKRPNPGGVTFGPRHSEGGIPTRFGELEGGEAVINRRSTKRFRPLLSAINQAGGGRAFEDGGIIEDDFEFGGYLDDYELGGELEYEFEDGGELDDDDFEDGGELDDDDFEELD